MKMTYDLLSLHLCEPFVSNKGSVSVVQQFMVRLHWGGRIGLGTAFCSQELGMTVDKVQRAIDRCVGLVTGASPFELERLLDRIEEVLPGQTAAIAAVDMALHDLLGQYAGMPLHQLWGLAGLPLPPTGFSLGALPEVALAARAQHFARWPILKLKITRPAISDVSVICGRCTPAAFGSTEMVPGTLGKPSLPQNCSTAAAWSSLSSQSQAVHQRSCASYGSAHRFPSWPTRTAWALRMSCGWRDVLM